MPIPEILTAAVSGGVLTKLADAGIAWWTAKRAGAKETGAAGAQVTVAGMGHAEQLIQRLMARVTELEKRLDDERSECSDRLDELGRRVDVAEARAERAEGRAESLHGELQDLRDHLR